MRRSMSRSTFAAVLLCPFLSLSMPVAGAAQGGEEFAAGPTADSPSQSVRRPLSLIYTCHSKGRSLTVTFSEFKKAGVNPGEFIPRRMTYNILSDESADAAIPAKGRDIRTRLLEAWRREQYNHRFTSLTYGPGRVARFFGSNALTFRALYMEDHPIGSKFLNLSQVASRQDQSGQTFMCSRSQIYYADGEVKTNDCHDSLEGRWR